MKKKKLFRNTYFKAWFAQFKLPKNAKLLDVGGGGGFYSWSFELFKFGEAHYVDVDPQSCQFASEKLGIKNVYNCFVQELPKDDKYDLIVCRHVIEHLKDPQDLINSSIDLLAPNGILVLVTPNATSIEGFGYPERLERRVVAIQKSGLTNRLKIY